MSTLQADQFFHYRRRQRRADRTRWTWWAIVGNGVSQAFNHAKTRTLLLTAGIPVLAAVGVFYVISLLESLVGTNEARGLYDFIRTFLQIDVSGVERISEFRGVLWRGTYLMIAKLQMFWIMIVVARVGAGLIANDLKARALPIYFSKPITPATYLLGKGAVAACFVALVTLVPNLVSLALGIALTGGLQTWAMNARIALDVAVVSLMACVVASAVILALSSITSDQRYVTVAWVAICLLPTVAQQILNDALPAETIHGWLGCVSPREDLVSVTERILRVRQGLEATSLPAERFEAALGHAADPAKATAVLAAVAAGAILIAWRRVVRFSRSASTA